MFTCSTFLKSPIRKLKDMLRGSILCKTMEEIQNVWDVLGNLEKTGVLIG